VISAVPEPLAAAVMVTVTVVEADGAEPVPVATTLKVPVVAVAEAEKVKVVLHVAVQLEAERPAVTPAGNPEVENATATGFPAVRVAVMVSAAALPCWIETAGEDAVSTTADGVRGGAAVVNVESAETAGWPVPF
jgi:hypothetical protein